MTPVAWWPLNTTKSRNTGKIAYCTISMAFLTFGMVDSATRAISL